jgi:hypothetical protein
LTPRQPLVATTFTQFFPHGKCGKFQGIRLCCVGLDFGHYYCHGYRRSRILLFETPAQACNRFELSGGIYGLIIDVGFDYPDGKIANFVSSCVSVFFVAVSAESSKHKNAH